MTTEHDLRDPYILKRKLFQKNLKKDLEKILEEIKRYEKQGVDIEKYIKYVDDICYDRLECKSLGIEYTNINNSHYYALLLTLIELDKKGNALLYQT